ncbi:hypothetical protein LBW59_00840 [Ralstonia solanacearum]|uniref:Uncharacterized protein n=1 Tax=Ralstonia solanacearum TaxID=305 RepID=A0AAW5ZGI6_RALSL|nr:hypothetical protein [Ralstonia solanacearum]MDB0569319.1 hypothetical protein [Ralstonia solanacearum]
MKKQISVPVSPDLFFSLMGFLRGSGDARDPVDVVSTAIEYWMDNASWKPELLTVSEIRGYQWKNLFLPEGTQLRMQYKGTYYYAKVEGDDIIYNGSPISPGSLANAIASSSRNAWRDLWLLRPNDREWRLADDCRQEATE